MNNENNTNINALPGVANEQATGTHGGVDGGAAALWASAFVILAMILGHAGSRSGNTAYARDVDDVASLRILDADAGSGEDIIVILNQSDDSLSVYSVVGQRSLELYQSVPLAELFEQPAGRPGPGGRR